MHADDAVSQLVTCDGSTEQMPTLLTSLAISGENGMHEGVLGMSAKPIVDDDTSTVATSPRSHLGDTSTAGNDVLFENVEPWDIKAQDSEQLQALLRAVSKLSHHIFGNDVVEKITEGGVYKMTLIARPEAEGSAKHLLVGFVVFKPGPKPRSLTISNLAVSPELRGQGHGKRLVDWCRLQRGVTMIGLVSLPSAKRFYRHYGFRQIRVWSEGGKGPRIELQGDQVYMEYHPPKNKGKSKKLR